eukprot:5314761-Prymnesium_polylepis.1
MDGLRRRAPVRAGMICCREKYTISRVALFASFARPRTPALFGVRVRRPVDPYLTHRRKRREEALARPDQPVTSQTYCISTLSLGP